MSSRIRLQGRVKRVDDDGDAAIDFDGIGQLVWVMKKDLHKLEKAKYFESKHWGRQHFIQFKDIRPRRSK